METGGLERPPPVPLGHNRMPQGSSAREAYFGAPRRKRKATRRHSVASGRVASLPRSIEIQSKRHLHRLTKRNDYTHKDEGAAKPDSKGLTTEAHLTPAADCSASPRLKEDDGALQEPSLSPVVHRAIDR